MVLGRLYSVRSGGTRNYKLWMFTCKINQNCPLLGDKHEETINNFEQYTRSLAKQLSQGTAWYHFLVSSLLSFLTSMSCCDFTHGFYQSSIPSTHHSCICLVKEPMSTSNKAFFTLRSRVKGRTHNCVRFQCPPGISVSEEVVVPCRLHTYGTVLENPEVKHIKSKS